MSGSSVGTTQLPPRIHPEKHLELPGRRIELLTALLQQGLGAGEIRQRKAKVQRRSNTRFVALPNLIRGSGEALDGGFCKGKLLTGFCGGEPGLHGLAATESWAPR